MTTRDDAQDDGRDTATIAPAAVAIDRRDLAAIELRGADVLRYLHSVSSQHLVEREPGEAARALLLSPKGKIEFAFRVAVLDGDQGEPGGGPAVVVDTDAAAAGGLAERLARFVFRYDVRVGEPVPGGLSLLDPGAVVAAGAAGLVVPADEHHATRHQVPGEGRMGWVVAHRTPLGLDLVGPGVGAVAATLAATGARAGAPELLEARRVELGLPSWGRELTDDVIAEEAGVLGSHVHLDKGCYPGQETVARVHNLGQVQRRLAGLLVHAGAPPPFRTDLFTSDGRRAGQVRSGVTHPARGPIALAFVRRVVPAGHRVRAGEVEATVVDLPF